jgi:hypothetical protein
MVYSRSSFIFIYFRLKTVFQIFTERLRISTIWHLRIQYVLRQIAWSYHWNSLHQGFRLIFVLRLWMFHSLFISGEPLLELDVQKYDDKLGSIAVNSYNANMCPRLQFHWLLSAVDSNQLFRHLKKEPFPERDNNKYFKLFGLAAADLISTPEVTEILSYLGHSELYWKKERNSVQQCVENAVQNALHERWILNPRFPHCFGVGTRQIPIFKSTETANDLPSVLSTKYPIFLELKSSKWKSERELYEEDADVILQAIERVFSVARHNALLRRIVIFATTGVKSWIFMLVREFPEAINFDTGKVVENYHLLPIDLAEIIPLWHCLNQKSSNFFFHEDCFLLSDVLSSVGYHLGYCQLNLLHKNTIGSHISTIYEITPGIHGKKDGVPVPGEENSFIIKLSLGSSRGNNEFEIVKKLCSEKSIAVDYVLMGLRSQAGSETLSMFSGDVKSMFKQRHSSDGIELDKSRLGFTRFSGIIPDQLINSSANCQPHLCWWNYVHPEETVIPEFTAIFMQPGMVVTKITREEAFELHVVLTYGIHEHGVLHCDPRKSNIVRFQRWEEVEKVDAITKLVTNAKKLVERVRLIDFDLSILKENEGEMQLTRGARAELLKSLEKFVKPVIRDGKQFVQMNTTLDSLMLSAVIQQSLR